LLERVRAEGHAPYDAVLSDLAPKTSGIHGVDEARSLALAERALGVALQVLKPGGAFVVKVFMGGEFEAFHRTCKRSFSQVKVVKPEASLARHSKEVYLVCREVRSSPPQLG
jgi:23S rRNA (uridine2552-2'-O)-methyltransferase